MLIDAAVGQRFIPSDYYAGGCRRRLANGSVETMRSRKRSACGGCSDLCKKLSSRVVSFHTSDPPAPGVVHCPPDAGGPPRFGSPNTSASKEYISASGCFHASGGNPAL